MKNLIVLIFLILGTIWDIKRKTVPVKYLVVWGIVSTAYVSFIGLGLKDVYSLQETLWGILPGGICLFLACVTKEQIGYGDGWIVMFVGMLLGIKKVLFLLFAALIIVTFFSIVLLMSKKAERKTTIPFIPFLLLGELVVSIVGGIL